MSFQCAGLRIQLRSAKHFHLCARLVPMKRWLRVERVKMVSETLSQLELARHGSQREDASAGILVECVKV
ncbi:hypothetical protein L204_100136 [Cryptococcus depauperatus]